MGNQRVLEPESMMGKEDVAAYDAIVRKHLEILHYGFVETIVNCSPASGRFLDVGAGTGWISIGVAEHNPNAEIYAFDLSEDMLAVAAENAEKHGVRDRIVFAKADAKGLPFPEASFDAVFSHNMMHHLPDPKVMLAEMKRVSRPDGGFFLRDLKRVNDFWRKFYVKVFGFNYDELMKREYNDSIRAAFSEDEWRELFDWLGLKGAALVKKWVTHMGIERPAEKVMDRPVKIPTPLFARFAKNLYVTSPANN